MLGAGFVGGLYIIAGSPLLTGDVDLSATEVDIATIERDGFPDGSYLTINDCVVVWPFAEIDRHKGEITSVVAPVTSIEVVRGWPATGTADASRVRLVAEFDPEQLEERWPGLLQLAEGDTFRAPAVTGVTLTGETIPLRHLVGNALPRLENLDKDAGRALYFERHSLGRSIRNLLFGAFLLVICFAMIVWHHRQPPRPSGGGRSEAAYAVASSAEALDDLVDDD